MMVSLSWKQMSKPGFLNREMVFVEGKGLGIDKIRRMDGKFMDLYSPGSFEDSTIVKKRDIPGISSKFKDHYLRDKDIIYSAYSRVNRFTEKDLYFGTLYVFVLMVFLTVVMAGIAFGIREYIISIKKKIKYATDNSAENTWSIRSTISLPSELVVPNTMTKEIMKGVYPDFAQVTARDSMNGFQRYLHKEALNEDISTSVDKFTCDDVGVQGKQHVEKRIEESLTDIPPTINISTQNEIIEAICVEEYHPIDIFHPGSSTAGFNDSSIEKFIAADHLSLSESREKQPTKMKFTFKQLNSIREEIIYFPVPDGDLEKFEGKRLEEILKFSINLPRMAHPTIWEAEKTINEIRSLLMNESPIKPIQGDTVTKQIAVYQFLSLGSSQSLFDNEYYFISSFTELVELISDTGAIFDILEESRPIIQILLLELLLRYCLSQWKFKEANEVGYNISYITNKIEKWRIREATIQSHSTIIRYLCNIKLGLFAVSSLSDAILKEADFKLRLLLTVICKGSYCNDYLGFIPILAKAVELSQNESSKVLFYDLVSIIVNLHADCCMKDYLHDKGTDLKSLVQHGLWHKNYPEVCRKVEEVYTFIMSKYPDVLSWWKEVDGGKIFVSSSVPKTETPIESSPNSNYNLSTFGTEYYNNHFRNNHIALEAGNSAENANVYNLPVRSVTPGAWNLQPPNHSSTNSSGTIAKKKNRSKNNPFNGNKSASSYESASISYPGSYFSRGT